MLIIGKFDYNPRVRILSSFQLKKLQSIARWTALWVNTLSIQSALPFYYIPDVKLGAILVILPPNEDTHVR